MGDCFGEIFDLFVECGLFELMLIVFVVDYGEELFEDGWVGYVLMVVEVKLIFEVFDILLFVSGLGVF